MTLTFTVEFQEGEIVYLRTDTDRAPRVVIGYYIQHGVVRYILCAGTDDSVNHECEIERKTTGRKAAGFKQDL